jgi:hypothetical protein
MAYRTARHNRLQVKPARVKPSTGVHWIGRGLRAVRTLGSETCAHACGWFLIPARRAHRGRSRSLSSSGGAAGEHGDVRIRRKETCGR